MKKFVKNPLPEVNPKLGCMDKIKRFLRNLTKIPNKMMANFPTIIRSCNAIAKQYLKIKQENPNKNEKDIYIELTNWLPSSEVNREVLLSMVKEDRIVNLTIFIYFSYLFNAGLWGCSDGLKEEVKETIRRELKKYSLE